MGVISYLSLGMELTLKGVGTDKRLAWQRFTGGILSNSKTDAAIALIPSLGGSVWNDQAIPRLRGAQAGAQRVSSLTVPVLWMIDP